MQRFELSFSLSFSPEQPWEVASGLGLASMGELDRRSEGVLQVEFTSERNGYL